MNGTTPLGPLVVLFAKAGKALCRIREGRFVPRHPEKVPVERLRSWSSLDSGASRPALTRHSVFPEPALQPRSEAGRGVGERGPLGAPSSPQPRPANRGRRLTGAAALAVWESSPPRLRNREWFRALVLQHAARHAVTETTNR